MKYHCPNCNKDFDEPKQTVSGVAGVFVLAFILSIASGGCFVLGAGMPPMIIVGSILGTLSFCFYMAFAVLYALSKATPSTKCPKCEYNYFYRNEEA